MAVKDKVQELLNLADVKINGNRPWDLQVHNEKLYSRVLAQGSIGFGEAYMDGWWNVKDLDKFFTKIFLSRINRKIVTFPLIWNFLKSKLTNLQTKAGSKKVAETHYDLGNDFYANMLDKRMQYTCAYWKGAKGLDRAQENKLDLVCKKLVLKKGDRVLELGCGWGGFAEYAAKKYGCHVTAYNISEEQVKYAREKCKGLPVEIIKADYREAKGTYDKVVSIGMCEHVGYKNYRNLKTISNREKSDDFHQRPDRRYLAAIKWQREALTILSKPPFVAYS